MADIKALLKDADFNQLKPEEQIYALSQIDPDFADMNLQEYGHFKLKMNSGSGGWKTPEKGPGFVEKAKSFIQHGPTDFMNFVTGHPVHEMSVHGKEMGDEARKAFKQGDYLTAVGKGLASFLPGTGDAAVAAGEGIGEGNYSGAAFDALMALGPSALHAVPEVSASSRLQSPVTFGEPRIPGLREVIKSYGPEGANIHPSLKEALGYSTARKLSGVRFRSPLTPPPGEVPDWLQTAREARGSSPDDVGPVQPLHDPNSIRMPLMREFPSGRVPGHIQPPIPPRKPFTIWDRMREERAAIPAVGSPEPPPLDIPAQTQFPSGRVPGTGEPPSRAANPPTIWDEARQMRQDSPEAGSPTPPPLDIPQQAAFPSGRVPGIGVQFEPTPRPVPRWIRDARAQRAAGGPAIPPVPESIQIPQQSSFPSGRIPGTGEPVTITPPVSPDLPDVWKEARERRAATSGPVASPPPPLIEIPKQTAFPSGSIPGTGERTIRVPGSEAPATKVPTIEALPGAAPGPKVDPNSIVIPSVEGVDPEYLTGREGHIADLAKATQTKARGIAQKFYEDPHAPSPDSVTDVAERRAWAKKAGYTRPFSDKTGDSTWYHVVREHDKLISGK